MNRAEYNRLQAEWDAKLRASGFKDIERRSTGLLSPDLADVQHAVKRARESGAELYYEQLAEYASAAVYRSRTERRCLELHLEGVSCRDAKPLLGGMRAGQVRRFKEFVRAHRQLAVAWRAGMSDALLPVRSLHEQHLEAEGFDRLLAQGAEQRASRKRAGNAQGFEAGGIFG